MPTNSKKRTMEMFVHFTREKIRNSDCDLKVGRGSVKKARLCAKPGSNRTISLEEKRKFRSELLLQVSNRKMEYFDSYNDKTSWKLRREFRAVLDDAKDADQKEKRRNPSGFAYAKERRSIFVNEEKSPNHLSNAAIAVEADQMSPKKAFPVAMLKSRNDLSTPTTAVEADQMSPKKAFPAAMLKSRNDLSTPTTAVEADQMSPKKALRVAMLKSRFADTIFKAMHQTLVLSHGHKSDPQRRQKEIERLEREQLKEKAKIAAEMRCLSRREEIERKRVAARIALEKMERTVVIDENKDILQDMEQLGLCTKGDYDYHVMQF